MASSSPTASPALLSNDKLGPNMTPCARTPIGKTPFDSLHHDLGLSPTWSPCCSACRILRRYTMTSGELVETPQLLAVSLLLSALIRLVFVASSRATLCAAPCHDVTPLTLSPGLSC